MKKVTIFCDYCDAALNDSEGMPSYRLRLIAESIPNLTSNICYDVLVYPPIENDHYFCGLGCLRQWVANK